MTTHDLASLSKTIDTAFDNRDSITTATKGEVRDAVDTVLTLLDGGEVRDAVDTVPRWWRGQLR